MASRYKRLSAWLGDKLSSLGEPALLPWKSKVFAALTRERGVHTVVEIGPGSGLNLPFYAARVDRIVAVDTNPAVGQYAERTAAAVGLPPGRLQLVTGSAEQLPLDDESMDAVVSTHVLCSVESPQRALAEVRRVLRPGGRFVFLEHVAAAPGSRLAALQRWVAPAVRLLADGCHVDRATLEDVRAAGFSGVQADEFYMDAAAVVAFWRPHVCGIAVK